MTEPAAPPPDAEFMAQVAAAFPQLELVELIGVGGMGRVYKARQPALDRVIALKVLASDKARDPEWIERFHREARALARLNHPNIVRVHDFGTVSIGGHDQPYLMMEFVDGVNLRQAMQAGALSAREALAIVPKLCDALHYAHEHDVLHRDIKPENVLIDGEGRVKLVDFGLAKLRDEAATAFTLTQSGVKLGTLAYMAPEQIEKPGEVDHRADIYSLGVVFYEMLTGELPLGRFPTPSEASGVDQRLDGVVMRTLEKNPQRRFESAGALRTEIESAASRVETRPPSGVDALNWRLLIGGAVCWLLGMLTVVTMYQPTWGKGWQPWFGTGLLLASGALGWGVGVRLRRLKMFNGLASVAALLLAVSPIFSFIGMGTGVAVNLIESTQRDAVLRSVSWAIAAVLASPFSLITLLLAWQWWRTGGAQRTAGHRRWGWWLLATLVVKMGLPFLPIILAPAPKVVKAARDWKSKGWSGRLVSEARRSDSPAARDTAIKTIIQEMESSDPAENEDGLLSFIGLQTSTFDKTQLRDAARRHFDSVPRLRTLAVRAVLSANFTDEDVKRVMAMVPEAGTEEFKSLAWALATISNKDFTGRFGPQMLSILERGVRAAMDDKRSPDGPRYKVDERDVLNPLWGAKLSPEIEAKLIEWSRMGVRPDGAMDTNGIGYNVFYFALSTQANKSEATVKRLLELALHPDATNVAGRCLWGLQRTVTEPKDQATVATFVIRLLGDCNDGYLWKQGLGVLQQYATREHLADMDALAARSGLQPDRKDDLLKVIKGLNSNR